MNFNFYDTGDETRPIPADDSNDPTQPVRIPPQRPVPPDESATQTFASPPAGGSPQPNPPPVYWYPPEELPREVLPPDPAAYYQPVRIQRPAKATKPARRRMRLPGCLVILLALLAFVLIYFLAPLRTNMVWMGVDRSPEGTITGRTDTIILVSVVPLAPTVNILSIPRDLWVPIPNVGENRINTAHFFAEAEQPGSGPDALALTIEENFDISIPYTMRVHFDGFAGIIDAMGGVDVVVPQDMAGLPAGPQHLDGAQALAFVRDRSGTDDFFRMAHTQLLLQAVLKQMLYPTTWIRIPEIWTAVNGVLDTNIPAWQWPRLGVALARSLASGVNIQTLDRNMAYPFTTDGGAQVLLPNWDLIRPLIREMFGARLLSLTRVGISIP